MGTHNLHIPPGLQVRLTAPVHGHARSPEASDQALSVPRPLCFPSQKANTGVNFQNRYIDRKNHHSLSSIEPVYYMAHELSRLESYFKREGKHVAPCCQPVTSEEPPSIHTSVPVIWLAASDARNSTSCPTSSAVAGFPSPRGIRPFGYSTGNLTCSTSLCCVFSLISVCVAPGQITFTRTLCGASSTANPARAPT